jgi:hypothetical protein
MAYQPDVTLSQRWLQLSQDFRLQRWEKRVREMNQTLSSFTVGRDINTGRNSTVTIGGGSIPAQQIQNLSPTGQIGFNGIANGSQNGNIGV